MTCRVDKVFCIAFFQDYSSACGINFATHNVGMQCVQTGLLRLLDYIVYFSDFRCCCTQSKGSGCISYIPIISQSKVYDNCVTFYKFAIRNLCMWQSPVWSSGNDKGI